MHKKLPPYLAHILWNCSGVDVNNLEAILVMTWHLQAAFQIQYGIFKVNSNEVKQDILNHSEKICLSWLFYFPLVPYICVGELPGSALIRVMVSRLFVPSHYLNQCWLIINWTIGNKIQWNCNWNSNTFIEDHSRFENVVCNFHIINGILYSYLICIWSGDV